MIEFALYGIKRNLEFPQQRESSPDKNPVNRKLISSDQIGEMS